MRKNLKFDDFFSGKISHGMMAHFEAGITPVKKRYMMTYFSVHLSKIGALLGGAGRGGGSTYPTVQNQNFFPSEISRWDFLGTLRHSLVLSVFILE